MAGSSFNAPPHTAPATATLTPKPQPNRAPRSETMITESWIAVYFWSDPLKARNQATGICIDGNDHYVTNVIVYSALVGIAVNGAANLFQGVHTWNVRVTRTTLRSPAAPAIATLTTLHPHPTRAPRP